jgi:carbon storage regulator CsrA
MLVLSRKVGEKLVIGDNITLTINRISGNRVTIGIEAPGSVKIVRGELERYDDHRPAPVGASVPAGELADYNRAPVIAHRQSR